MNQPLLQMDLRLVAAAVVVLAAAVSVIWWFGRRLRRELGPLNESGPHELRVPGSNGPPQVAKLLQQRGLATPAQLATMTEAERQLLFSTLAGAMREEAGSDSMPRGSLARAVVRPDELPTLYCPLCGYRIERFTSSLPVTGQCETCAAKVVVRRDAGRVLLTVIAPDDASLKRPGLRLDS